MDIGVVINIKILLNLYKIFVNNNLTNNNNIINIAKRLINILEFSIFNN